MRRSGIGCGCVAAVLALAAAACGDGSPAVTATTPAGVPVRVGLVTDATGLVAGGFNAQAKAALERARTDLGIGVDVVESSSADGYAKDLDRLSATGHDLVIAVGFDMESALGEVARRHPGTHYAIVDDSTTVAALRGLANVVGLGFRDEEAGYLAGYLAGLIEVEGGPHTNDADVVSSVGAVKGAAVDRSIAGFQAGVRAADPGVTILNAYSNDFVDTAKCRDLALDQIARGSDVVFQVAGGCGDGALLAAAAAGVWGVGSAVDQSARTATILTSATKGVDASVLAAVRAEIAGTFRGGTDTALGVREHGVGITTINAAVPAAVQAKVAAVQKRLAAGAIAVPRDTLVG